MGYESYTDEDADVEVCDSPSFPPKYKVILLNDDFTTMEFVIYVLETIFSKSPSEAQSIMSVVHTTGRGIAGVYTYDMAMSRSQLCMKLARKAQFPLRCEVEEE